MLSYRESEHAVVTGGSGTLLDHHALGVDIEGEGGGDEGEEEEERSLHDDVSSLSSPVCHCITVYLGNENCSPEMFNTGSAWTLDTLSLEIFHCISIAAQLGLKFATK